jgi:DHA2 family multidrug resistance protein
VGLLLYATRALLPPMLQTLMGYPVVTTGLVTGPSGIGTMVAMMLAGRWVGKIDPRALIALGFSCTAFSLWQMSGYTFNMSESSVVWPGVIQGMGVGFVSVPLTTVTFSTLDPKYRPDGTSIFSLSRNIGSSIGISLMQTLLTRNSAIFHAHLAEQINWANPAIRGGLPALYDPHTVQGLAALNSEVTRQASFMAYITDYRIMMIATIAALPFLLLMRTNGHAPPAEIDANVME